MTKVIDVGKEIKIGGVRLFTPADTFSSVHGWRALRQNPLRGLVNPKGWACLHIVVQKLCDGAVLQDLYDQVLIVENPGAVVVCRQGALVGLIRQFRFTAERLADLSDANSTYLRRLIEEDRWEELLATLGRWQWELPAGMSPAASGLPLAQYIKETANIEADSEGGFEIFNERICGRINANSRFFAHPQYVVAADIKRVGETKPEALELIGKARLFDPPGLRKLAEAGEIDDALSLGALALAGVAF
jgi:hypothetical protein